MTSVTRDGAGITLTLKTPHSFSELVGRCTIALAYYSGISLCDEPQTIFKLVLHYVAWCILILTQLRFSSPEMRCDENMVLHCIIV